MNDSVFDISIKEAEFEETLKAAERAHDSITSKWLKSTQRRKLKPMMNAMRAGSKSTRIGRMIGITTAKKRAGEFGAKVGVTRTDADMFPNITPQALASLIEYGSEGERFRQLRAGVFITGRQSTGRMPATPWLRPAWDMHVQGFMASVEESIEKKVLEEFNG